MKIGQVAQRYGISRDNLYYYINYGLLVPPRMDKQYVFDDETLSDLERILELKELGFTLAEIHHILSLFRISDMEKTAFGRNCASSMPSGAAAVKRRSHILRKYPAFCHKRLRSSPPWTRRSIGGQGCH